MAIGTVLSCGDDATLMFSKKKRVFFASLEICPKFFLPNTRPGDDLPLRSARRSVPQKKATEEQNNILSAAVGGELSYPLSERLHYHIGA